MSNMQHGTLGQARPVFSNYIQVTKYPTDQVYQYDVTIRPLGGEDFRRLPPIELTRQVFDSAMRINRKALLRDTPMVFDGRKVAYAPRPVCDREQRMESQVDEDGKTSKFEVVVREVARVDMAGLREYMRGGQMDIGEVQKALNALDLAIGSVLHREMVGFNRSFFTRAQSLSIAGGLELWRGFSFSFRPGLDQLYLNVNTAVTAMYAPNSLVDSLKSVLNVRDIGELRGRVSERFVREAQGFLKGLTLYNRHRGMKGKRKFVAKGVTHWALDEETFEWADPETQVAETVSVAEYYRRRYNIQLRYGFLPGLVGRKNAVFPIELCEVAENQRYRGKLDDRQTADMVKFACQRPSDNMDRITDVLAQLDLSRSPVVKSFGLEISSQLSRVESRVLPPPTVDYGRGSRGAKAVPRGGCWNMRDKQVAEAAGPLRHWGVLVLASRQMAPDRTVQGFVGQLVRTCQVTGYRVENSRPSIMYGNASRDVAQEMHALADQVRRQQGAPPQLLLVVLASANTQVYQSVKNAAYTQLGVHTQCMLARHLQRASPQYCANLCLKLNAKLGGYNHALPVDHLRGLLGNKPTLFLGCDVTHPGHGEQGRPSIAAVVGSTNLLGTRYAATLVQLPSRQEIVARLQEVVIRHLKLFYAGTKAKPQRIVMYRDGVSEGQFAQVRDRELIEIQRACASVEAGYRPEITFLAVLKRHNARFFPAARDGGDKTGNCVPGTVVDRRVTLPGMTDFYLFAHAAIQGTSRPTHYYVLHDDARMSADRIQQLTYHLCYTYAICTRSVSLVPPVYYAHRVADRARCHLVEAGTGFEEATSESAGYYGGAGTAVGARSQQRDGDPLLLTKVIKINSMLNDSMYFM